MLSDVRREQVAVRAGRRGAQEAINRFRSDISVETKADNREIIEPADAVTEADRAVQKIIIEEIRRSYPEDTIIGEENETSEAVPESGIGWLIDPIDGTYNYIRGLNHWSTSIGIVKSEDPAVAVNIIPAINDTYIAGSNYIELNDEPISVSDRTQIKTATVAPVVIPSIGERTAYAGGVAQITEEFGNLRRFGSAQVSLSLVASGAIEGAIGTINPNPWDTVAGAHLVRRAGGKVTDIHGSPWSHGSHGIIASNGDIHEKLVNVGQTMVN
jgi:myo-inositol-1(or 4)-monophosphatase